MFTEEFPIYIAKCVKSSTSMIIFILQIIISSDLRAAFCPVSDLGISIILNWQGEHDGVNRRVPTFPVSRSIYRPLLVQLSVGTAILFVIISQFPENM